MRTPPRRSVSSDCVAFGVRIRGARNDSEVAELSAIRDVRRREDRSPPTDRSHRHALVGS